MERKAKEEVCAHCGGKGRLSDEMPKSRFPALDWMSFDGETCNSCGGSGKIPPPKNK